MVEKMNAASSLVEVVDRILDMGIVIDKFLAFLKSRYSHKILMCGNFFTIIKSKKNHPVIRRSFYRMVTEPPPKTIYSY
jgi:hypothetical protein